MFLRICALSFARCVLLTFAEEGRRTKREFCVAAKLSFRLRDFCKTAFAFLRARVRILRFACTLRLVSSYVQRKEEERNERFAFCFRGKALFSCVCFCVFAFCVLSACSSICKKKREEGTIAFVFAFARLRFSFSVLPLAALSLQQDEKAFFLGGCVCVLRVCVVRFEC